MFSSLSSSPAIRFSLITLTDSASNNSGAIAPLRPCSTPHRKPSNSSGNGPSGINSRIYADVSTTPIIAGDPAAMFLRHHSSPFHEGEGLILFFSYHETAMNCIIYNIFSGRSRAQERLKSAAIIFSAFLLKYLPALFMIYRQRTRKIDVTYPIKICNYLHTYITKK